MYYIKVGNEYLTWYRSNSGIKTSINEDDAKIYKAKSSANNAVSKVTSMTDKEVTLHKKEGGVVESKPVVKRTTTKTKDLSYGVMFFEGYNGGVDYFTISHYAFDGFKRGIKNGVAGIPHSDIKKEMKWCLEQYEKLTPEYNDIIDSLVIGEGTQFIDLVKEQI